ncbi:MAG: hypothetical protein FD189_1055 [Elusimicrobia bacterium]|nr:MAG: hypothetical protein FD189_1055 [Elusimicrobiota bacterium]
MEKVQIVGNIHQFTAKAPKSGAALGRVLTKLCIPAPDHDVLAALCEGRAGADAIRAAVKAKGKLELTPSREEVCIRVQTTARGAVYETAEVRLETLVVDCSGDDPEAELHYEEPLNKESVLMVLATLGQPLEVTITPAQMTLPGAENPKGKRGKQGEAESVTISGGGKSVTLTKETVKNIDKMLRKEKAAAAGK